TGGHRRVSRVVAPRRDARRTHRRGAVRAGAGRGRATSQVGAGSAGSGAHGTATTTPRHSPLTGRVGRPPDEMRARLYRDAEQGRAGARADARGCGGAGRDGVLGRQTTVTPSERPASPRGRRARPSATS